MWPYLSDSVTTVSKYTLWLVDWDFNIDQRQYFFFADGIDSMWILSHENLLKEVKPIVSVVSTKLLPCLFSKFQRQLTNFGCSFNSLNRTFVLVYTYFLCHLPKNIPMTECRMQNDKCTVDEYKWDFFFGWIKIQPIKPATAHLANWTLCNRNGNRLVYT